MLASPEKITDRANKLAQLQAVDWGVDEPGLFGTGPVDRATTGTLVNNLPRNRHAYLLRRDLGVPERLKRENAPTLSQPNDLASEAAACFQVDERVRDVITRHHTVNVAVHLRELFQGAAERTETFAARPSRAKLVSAAQTVLQFSDDVDPRRFRRLLAERLQREVTGPGGDLVPMENMLRAVDLLAVFRRHLIEDALASALARHASVTHAAPLPGHVDDLAGLFPANRSAYGMFPSGLNGPERRFAELLDEMDGVRWWLRNPGHPSCDWSVRLHLPNGKGYFPDFVIGVDGRRTLDSIALAEVKDDGGTGRLNADLNIVKYRHRLADYGALLWVAEEESGSSTRFMRLRLSDDHTRIVRDGALRAEHLRD